MDWTMPLDAHDRGHLADLCRRFAACARDIEAGARDADAVASALAAHIASVTAPKLPPAAQPIWSDRIARPLKADGRKPLPARAVASARSWPRARIDDFVAALTDIATVLEETENEALHAEILADIARAYS